MSFAREYVESQLDAIERGDVIAILWGIEDVLMQAGEMGVKLTDDDAREILDNVRRGHDATIGIDWVVIETHIDMWRADREEKV